MADVDKNELITIRKGDSTAQATREAFDVIWKDHGYSIVSDESPTPVSKKGA